MRYFVRVYCHQSFEFGTCDCTPPHPYVIDEAFDSLRAANDVGDRVIGIGRDDDIEWEVIHENGELAC